MKPIFHSVDSATKNLFSRGYTRLLLGFFSALVSFSLLAAPHEARAQAQAAKERSIDFKDNIQTGNAQLISILSPKLLNEFRFQYSRRNQPSVLNDLSGQGPSITVIGRAQFGAPAATGGPLLFNERITQFLDNVNRLTSTISTSKTQRSFATSLRRIITTDSFDGIKLLPAKNG